MPTSSTLLKILSRITAPTTGKITYHGRVASLLEVGTGFHPELSGRENIYLNGAILGMSRAIGETMVVAIAAGQQPNFTWDPRESAATITAYIVQVALGDLPHGSIGYQSIFAVGLVLFLMTLAFNILGHMARQRFREIY